MKNVLDNVRDILGRILRVKVEVKKKKRGKRTAELYAYKKSPETFPLLLDKTRGQESAEGCLELKVIWNPDHLYSSEVETPNVHLKKVHQYER